MKKLLVYDEKTIKNLKRCSKCILPSTFPFIKFNDRGVCNYCENYEKITYKNTEEIINKIKNQGNKVLITFSGGRDSSYGMHLLNQLDIDMIAYTYNWGMLTEISMRNQKLMTEKLNVKHIVIDANIKRKQANIKRNIKAWLKKPNLGLVPLFVSGDKHYFYYANKVAKENNLQHQIIMCDNPLEVTYFKFGFAGIKPNFIKKGQLFRLPFPSVIKMFLFYLKEFIKNPQLLNLSIFDTLSASISYYFIPHDYINLFKYFPWEEEKIDKVLTEQYGWNVSQDSKTTWRIGDGTTAFYNYIYATIAGFTENDTFRSNQIREGLLNREQALNLILEENRPREESIKWYLNQLDLDYETTISAINNAKRLY